MPQNNQENVQSEKSEEEIEDQEPQVQETVEEQKEEPKVATPPAMEAPLEQTDAPLVMDDDLAELDGDEFGWNDGENMDIDLDLGLDGPQPDSVTSSPVKEEKKVNKQEPVLDIMDLMKKDEPKKPNLDDFVFPPVDLPPVVQNELPTAKEEKVVAPNNSQDDTAKNNLQQNNQD